MVLNKEKQLDSNEIIKFLYAILNGNLKKEDVIKIMSIEAEVTAGCPYLLIIQKIAKVPLLLKKSRIDWSNASLSDANKLATDWNPVNWNLVEVVRAILLISWASKDRENFINQLTKYFKSAESGEQVSILKCLSLFPNADKLELLAEEGINSNIKVVFEAIAVNNRYPALFFSIDLWNKMVTKVASLEGSLSSIINLKEKSNYNLAIYLCDLIHEKWNQEKLFSPEVWGIISPYINESLFKTISIALSRDDEDHLEAILLSCYESNFPKAQSIVNSYPQEAEIISGKINWDTIGAKWNIQKMLHLSK